MCDAFDAMTAERAYRAALTIGAALAELERCAGTQFDPLVVAAFAELRRAPLALATGAAADSRPAAPPPKAGPHHPLPTIPANL